METTEVKPKTKKGPRPASLRFFQENEARKKRLAAASEAGARLDEAIQNEVAALLLQAQDSNQREFLTLALDVVRDCQYSKPDVPEGFERDDLDYAKQTYAKQAYSGSITGMDVDYAVAFVLIEHCRRTHLPPALVQFEIKVLQAALNHYVATAQTCRYKDRIVSELSQRQKGIDTYTPPPPAPIEKKVVTVVEPRITVADSFVAGLDSEALRQHAALLDVAAKAKAAQDALDAGDIRRWQQHHNGEGL